MDNLRRALALRWCRMSVREYDALVRQLREVVGVQAETIAGLRELVLEHKRMARDIASLALEMIPEDSDARASLERTAARLRDQVALVEEYDL